MSREPATTKSVLHIAAAKREAGPAIITHTTAHIAGLLRPEISVFHAATDSARIIVTFGTLMMTFHDAATTTAVIEGFAAVKPSLMGLDNRAPELETAPNDFALNTFSVTWIAPPKYAIVRHSRYNEEQRRTVVWVDLHMGPITWRIDDHTGYYNLMTELRNVHKTAVAVFTDGRKHRADPTRDRDLDRDS